MKNPFSKKVKPEEISSLGRYDNFTPPIDYNTLILNTRIGDVLSIDITPNDTIISTMRKMNLKIETLLQERSKLSMLEELESKFESKIKLMVENMIKEKLEEIVFMISTINNEKSDLKKKFSNVNIVVNGEQINNNTDFSESVFGDNSLYNNFDYNENYDFNENDDHDYGIPNPPNTNESIMSANAGEEVSNMIRESIIRSLLNSPNLRRVPNMGRSNPNNDISNDGWDE